MDDILELFTEPIGIEDRDIDIYHQENDDILELPMPEYLN